MGSESLPAISSTPMKTTLEPQTSPSTNSTSTNTWKVGSTALAKAQFEPNSQTSLTASIPSNTHVGTFQKVKTIFLNILGLTPEAQAKKNEGIFNKIANKEEFAKTDIVKAKELFNAAVQTRKKVSSVVAKALAKGVLRAQTLGVDVTEVKARQNFFKSHKFTVLVDSKNNQVSLSKMPKRLGGGGFGDVFRTSFNKLSQVMKLVRTEFTKPITEENKIQLNEELNNEVILLKEINPNGDQVGIQKPPHTLITFATKNNKEKRIGYLATLYEGSLEKSTMKKDPVLRAMQQIFTGLKYLKAKNICHGDIKPANMFMRDHGKTFHLADFGGSQPIDINSNKLIGTGSRAFLAKDDDRLSELFQALEKKEEFKNVLLGRDMYATCLSFYQIILGIGIIGQIRGNPEANPPIPSIPPQQFRQQLLDKGIPKEICDLLEQGLSEDYTERPTPEDFLKALNS